MELNQKGVVPVLILFAAIGLVAFVLLSSSVPLKNQLLAQLFPKKSSFAAISAPISGPINASPSPSPSLTAIANPGKCVNNAGSGSVAWANPDRARFNDSQWAYASLNTTNGALTSNTLACLGYGLNIPQTAIIKGIRVNIKRGYDPTKGTASDALVRLLLGTSVTSADRSASTPYNNGEGIYGGSNDLWGNTWTPTQINNGNFGVAFATQGNTFVGVDAVTITVYYSLN